MKTIKVAEATELQLDWLVARIEGDELPKGGGKGLDYSTDWACGGPIKEREKIGTNWVVSNYLNVDGCWSAHIPQSNGRILYAQTELVAAMRCYVISKLGETAEVPEELV